MNIKLNIILSLLLFFLFLQEKKNKKLVLVDKISLDTDSVFLKTPKEFIVSEKVFFWVEDFNIKVFSKNGTFLFKHEKVGNGPGEYNKIDDAELQGSSIFVFDNNSKKVVKYQITGEKFEYLSETYVKVLNNRNFTVDKNGHYYFLLSHTLNDNQASISEFNENGRLVREYGNLPVLAALSRGLKGGGITASGDNIYYSYLGDSKLYYSNTDSKKSSYLHDVPDYFTEADSVEVAQIERSLPKLIRYAFKVSQISDVVKHRDYILQVVSDGGVGMGRDKQNFIEVWKESTKVASKVLISSEYVASDGEYIYSLVDDMDTKLEKSLGKIELVNKYTF